MKTYTKTSVTEEKRLEISYDECPESPRNWGSLGYFITKERDYHSPDGKDHRLYGIMLEAEERVDNMTDHMKEIKKQAKEEGIKIVAIYPISRYEHSGVVYSIGEKNGWDYSPCGFYIVTDKSLKEYGARNNKKSFERFIKAELENYNRYVNGEVYSFVLYNEQGEIEDSCCGFYDIESIREYLPKEWEKEDLEDYIKY